MKKFLLIIPFLFVFLTVSGQEAQPFTLRDTVRVSGLDEDTIMERVNIWRHQNELKDLKPSLLRDKYKKFFSLFFPLRTQTLIISRKSCEFSLYGHLILVVNGNSCEMILTDIDLWHVEWRYGQSHELGVLRDSELGAENKRAHIRTAVKNYLRDYFADLSESLYEGIMTPTYNIGFQLLEYEVGI